MEIYLDIPEGIRAIPDEIIRNRGKAYTVFQRRSEAGGEALGALVDRVVGAKKRRRR